MISKTKERGLSETTLCVLKDTIIEMGYSRSSLQEAYKQISATKNQSPYSTKLLAEVTYLLAQDTKKENPARAKELGLESIRLYKSLNIKTIEESDTILGGPLPDYMHDGVVKSRLLDCD